MHITSWQLLAVTVDVVPSIEQPVLVREHVVLYDAHEELDVVLTHSIRQLETVAVAVQLGLDRLVPLSVRELVGERVGKLVGEFSREFSRDSVGELVGELVGDSFCEFGW